MKNKTTYYQILKKHIWMLVFIKGINFSNIKKFYSEENGWLNYLLSGIDNDANEAPKFPSEEIQNQYVGSSYEHSLREAFKFYLLIKGYACDLGIPINKKTKILDFGCGWGRITRFFYKDVHTDNILGIDVEPNIIDVCNETMPHKNFQIIDKEPPLKLPANSIDIICSYSVFSHLAEDIAIKWFEEFSRILKPGGIIVATTHSKNLINYCNELRKTPSKQRSDWHRMLAKSFIDTNKTKKAYNEGEFIYAATGGGGVKESTFYGETILSKKYVKNKFTNQLNFIDFFDNTSKLPQALMVLQKPSQDKT